LFITNNVRKFGHGISDTLFDMKKVFALLFVLCYYLIAISQDESYNSFVEEGKVWNMLCSNKEPLGMYPDYEWRFFIKGDTTISDLCCKKLYVYNEDNNGQTLYELALYETEGKVYFIPNGSSDAYLLYDFQIPVNQTNLVTDVTHPEWKIEMRNNKEKFIKTNGVNRHCLYVNRVNSSGKDSPSGWWIEGIGSELGPLNTWLFKAYGNCNHLLNCGVNGQLVFNLSDFKNSATGIVGINNGQLRKDTGAIYDLSGRKIANSQRPTAKGLYIMNGKKVAIP
jgi:hypothetical protein